MEAVDPLQRFAEPTRTWFAEAFAGPTPAQVAAWLAAAAGEHVLVSAPTGSGKTLAAFLAALDRLLLPGGEGSQAPRSSDTGGQRAERAQARRSAKPGGRPATRVLYVSPLKALAYDVDRNLRAPLVGISRAAARLGQPIREVTVGIRSGDTSAEDRRRMARRPPDILITTPESLFLLLTSRARETLAAVETVIVDEVHAVAGTKRGAHLALSLERLERLVADGSFQRIGLSATQRPLEEVARFLGGGVVDDRGDWHARPVTVVEPRVDKQLEVEIVVPVDDMARPGDAAAATDAAAGLGEDARQSIWPAIHPRILDLVEAHRSTIVFVNSRRLAERLCTRLNDLHAERAGELDPAMPLVPIARAHHGSVAREERVGIEEDLKAGRLRCVVATSSLELGIDMGAVDLVIQVESPGSVASGLQRIGRAGHHVGAPSVGKVFPKFRGDLLEAAVVVRRMHERAIEETRYPRNPLDVLAQQVVAMAALDSWPVDDLHRTVRGAAGFADLSRPQLDGVLDMLSGRYPSDEFAELRPRLNWDRVADVVTGRPGAQRLAVTSGGTIPDRGLYGVFLADGGDGRAPRRVGELDEEMVYETRPGETIVLGSTTWRIADITRDQVLVEPAPGEHGKLPFWHGDALGRPIEVGRAVGAFLREFGDVAVRDAAAAISRLEEDYALDRLAASNLVAYLAEQREATGALPDDRTIVIERFRDEIGDWRVVVHSPFGGRVHAPWALAVERRARERLGLEVQVIYADEGLVVRVPEADTAPPAETVLADAGEVEDLIVAELGVSALFASRFRECAARALLLPRRVGGSAPGGMKRTPLWQQRQKAADLLAVASRYGTFPVILETYRECLRDVFDVPALIDLLRRIESREIRVVQVETPVASPFASSLLFDYVAGYMYEGDAPLAERRAAALALDRELLAELVGSDELRELIDPEALADVELELQRLAPGRRARHLDAVHDLLREVGDLRADELAARVDGPAAEWLDELEAARRAIRVRVAGEERWAAAEDAARLRDALGVPPPPGLPERFLDPVDRPLIDLVARYARTHGPFRPEEVAARLGLPRDAVDLALKELDRERRVTAGEFRPGGTQREWCDTEVLRRVRRRSLAALRREVEPVEPAALARFLPAWQGVAAAPGSAGYGGPDRVLEVVEQLQGAPLIASALDQDVLGIRVAGYVPAWLDELCASGEVVWVGRGARGSDDGRVSLYLRDQAPLLAPVPGDATAEDWWSELHAALVGRLAAGPAFWPQLFDAAARPGASAGSPGAAGGSSGAADGSSGAPDGSPGAADASPGAPARSADARVAGSGPSDQDIVEALWDLVWAGVVTNDGLGALRAITGGAPRRARGGGRRPRPGRALVRSGPPQAAGRWSLVADVVGEGASPTARAAALAAQLLDRHGVVTRDAVTGEDVPGGFAGVYPALKAMEEAGRARRGYFVEGLGGAQFALPGAVDRLRGTRQDDLAGAAALVLAATDPASPFGAALPWPEPAGDHGHAPKRLRGAYVVLVGGALAVYVEKGGRSLVTFSDDEDVLAAASEGLARLVTSGRVGRLQVQRIDAEPVDAQPLAAHLRSNGFADHLRGLILRR